MRVFACVMLAVLWFAGPLNAEPASPYAGEDICAACHADEADTYAKTPHAAALAAPSRPESERGCETCHGPGQAHADEGGGRGVGHLQTFARAGSVTERSAPCLACHGGKGPLHDVARSEHARAGVACPDCHRLHGGRGDTLLRDAPPALCYGCHQEVRAKFALPEHHKVNEGVVSCLDCHQPHGTPNTRLLRDANDRTCVRCHGELEGPFVFEHNELIGTGCARCHEPHGSINRHLLIRQQVGQLCAECHNVTPTSHVQPSYRDCTRCHVDIHGSNHDPRFLER